MNYALSTLKERVERGDRNIAISNVGHVAFQQKYLLSILSFLKNESEFKNKKIGLVSFNLQFGLYKNYVLDRDAFVDSYFTKDDNAWIVQNKMGSHFIDWSYMIHTSLSDKISDYDLLLWDLPDLNFINTNSRHLEFFFKTFDSLIIVSLMPNGVEKDEHMKRIYDFYRNHGLKLPDFIADKQGLALKERKITDTIRRIVGF